MRRRALCGSLVALLGGCAGLTTADTDTTTTTCPVPTTERVTIPRVTPTITGTGQIPQGLEIRSAYPNAITVILIQLPEEKTTFAREYPADREVVELHEEMVDYADYAVTIRGGCEVLWERTISDAEALTISIDSDGSVTIDMYAQA